MELERSISHLSDKDKIAEELTRLTGHVITVEKPLK